MRNELNATLVERIDITEGLLVFKVRPDAGILGFTPGQYVALGLMNEDGKILKRTYSIGSSPDEKDSFEFYLAIVPNGALTPRLAKLQEGDRLFCASKVTGKFTLDPIPQDKNILMLATGTGIAPYLSMLRTSSTWQRSGKITLVYGVRYAEDIAYLAELQELKDKHSDFSFHITVSRPEQSKSPDWAGEKGYIQNFFNSGRILLDPEKDHLMLCGNPAMIADMQGLLLLRGFIEHTRKQEGNLHLEKYW